MALAAVSTISLVPRVSAGAATEGSLRSEAAALTARLAALGQQEARADEQYNQATLALAAAQTRQQQAQAAAARAASQVSARRRILASAAVDAYMQGGQVGAFTVLMQSTQNTVGIQQSYLRSVADTQQADIDGLQQAEARLAVQQAALSQATAAARSDVSQASALRSQLGSTASSELAALSQVKGQLAVLVAADQAAAAARAAAAAAARQRAINAAVGSVSRDNPLPLLGGGGGGGVTGGGGSGGGVAPVGPVPPQGSAAGTAVAWAQRELGKPYEYGAAGPDSFDCSGLVMYVYAQAGISLPHSAAGQWDDTTRISYADARPGDLVFFYQPVDHVGIYVGNGEMIDAPHTGANVEYDPIWWNVLDGFGRVG